MRRFAALALAACSAPAPAPTHKPTPPPAEARDEDLARFPDDTWAVGALDLAQLRTSLARRWVWDFAGERSAIVHRCRDELAAGTRASVAIAGEKRDDTYYLIVHGVDAAAIARCAAVVDPPARDLPPTGDDCDRFDAAVHALHGCGNLPETQVPLLADAAVQLVNNGRAACPAATRAIEAAAAHRGELGWSCEAPRRDPRDRRAEHLAAPAVAHGTSLVIASGERLDVLDAHTVAITLLDGPDETRLAAGAAKLVPARHPRWFESQASALDRTRGAWAVAKLRELGPQPVAVGISGGIRGDLAFDLQIAHASSELGNEIASMIQQLASNKDFAGAKVAIGCSPIATPARTPKRVACEAAAQHLGSFAPADGIDVSGLQSQVVERCVTDAWPDDFVACASTASGEHGFAGCFTALTAADRERVEHGLTTQSCGERALAVHVAMPDARIEALKLATAMSRTERDCRAADIGQVSVAFDDRGGVSACVGPACTAFDLASGHPLGEGYVQSHGACVGPLFGGPTRGAWTDAKGRCDQPYVANASRGEIDPTKLPHDISAISADGKRALAVGKRAITVYEVPSARVLGKLALGKACTTATFLGDLVAVGCGAQSYLATPGGVRLATLGDVLLAPLPLPDHTWALVARAGDRIDLYTGGGKKQTELAVPHRADEADAVTDGKGTIAIAYGGTGPDAGAIAIVDAKQALRVLQLPTCPPAGH